MFHLNQNYMWEYDFSGDEMKILLTGASGFIGKNLKEYWSGKYDLYTPGHSELDLQISENVHEYLKKQNFDVIVHTANTNDFKYKLDEYDILDHNLRMFYNLENNSQFYGKLYYFGSGAQYDARHYKPKLKETDFGRYLPIDPYGFAKYTMSRIAEKSNNVYDLRLFGVYGKYEQWERRFISNALCRSVKGMPITISKNVKLDYLFIEDLCEIMEWFILHEPKYHCYNVCTGNPIDLKRIAEEINDVTGLNRKIVIKEPGYKLEYSGNNSRLMKEMGAFKFKNLKEAIEQLFEYYKSIERQIDERQLI